MKQKNENLTKTKTMSEEIKNNHKQIFRTYSLSVMLGVFLSYFTIRTLDTIMFVALSTKLSPVILLLSYLSVSIILFVLIIWYSATLLFKDLLNIFNINITEEKYSTYKTYFKIVMLILFISFFVIPTLIVSTIHFFQ